MTVNATMHDLSIEDWGLGRPVGDEWVEALELQNHVGAVYQQVPVSLPALGLIEELPIMSWTTVWEADLHIPELVAQVVLSVYAENGASGDVTFRITDGTNTATTATITTLAEETATLTLAATGDVTLSIQAQVTGDNAPCYGVMVEFAAISAGSLP